MKVENAQITVILDTNGKDEVKVKLDAVKGEVTFFKGDKHLFSCSTCEAEKVRFLFKLIHDKSREGNSTLQMPYQTATSQSIMASSLGRSPLGGGIL